MGQAPLGFIIFSPSTCRALCHVAAKPFSFDGLCANCIRQNCDPGRTVEQGVGGQVQRHALAHRSCTHITIVCTCPQMGLAPVHTWAWRTFCGWIVGSISIPCLLLIALSCRRDGRMSLFKVHFPDCSNDFHQPAMQPGTPTTAKLSGHHDPCTHPRSYTHSTRGPTDVMRSLL